MSNKVPQIRFNGYSDAWVQRKLTDISEKVTEKNSNNEFSETLTNSAEYGIISQRDFFDKDISNEKNLNTYYVVRDGDFVYNPRISNFAPVGPIKRNTLGRTGVMSPLYYVFRTHDIDGMYLEKYFSSTKWHRFMELNGDTGARADRFAIKDKDFVQMPIPLPNLDEQSKIAHFLESVDNLIAANQRKLDLLKEQKKGYLQKMFPKNGAKVPELRFAGFADDWEERKLGDAVNISSGVTGDATLQNGKYRLTRIESISQGMLNVARLGFTNEKPDQKYLLNLGDILYSNINSLSHIGKVALVDTTGIYHGINLLRFQMRKGVDSEFLFQRLNTMPMKNWAVSHANPAVSQASINQTELSKQPISSPTLTEQQQIGSFFKEIDNTIALHQRKLDLLKEQKAGFLQRIFV